MTSFVFSTLQNASTAFDPLSDTIIFSSANGSASAFNLVETSIDGQTVVQITRIADEPLIAAGATNLVATLTGVRLAQITGSNLQFFASLAIIGDNTTNAPTVGETFATFDDLPQTVTGGGGDELILGLGGNDVIDASGGNDFINGNAGTDLLTGGDGNDTVRGGQDNDTLSLGSGNNDANGNKGNDLITGGSGNEVLRGGQDNDTITGDSGSDTLKGNLGDDSLSLSTGPGQVGFAEGGEGNDTVTAAGASTAATLIINGNSGNDSIVGSPGSDSLRGGQGADALTGGLGSDTLLGDFDNDILRGSEGDDVLRGGPGDDTIIGNSGDDLMYGGSGNDIFQQDFTENSTENNSIIGSDGVDTLDLTVAIVNTTVLNLNNVSGVDVLRVPEGIVNLTEQFMLGTDFHAVEINAASSTGTAGINVDTSAVISSAYSVTLSRAATETFFLSSTGADRVFLKGGNAVSSLAGNDTIIGDSSSDTITSGTGSDVLTGGSGADTFTVGTTDSNATDGVDIITDFDRTTDRIDVDFTVSASAGVSLNSGAASSIAEVEALFSGVFNDLGDANIINITSGGLMGQKFVLIEANGVLGYQSGADYMIQLSNISETITNLLLI